MANVSSNNLTSLYGGSGFTVLSTTPVPVVEGTVSSKNLTTLYSGVVPLNTDTGNGTGTANIIVLDEGTIITTHVESFNFVGNGVVATANGNAVTVTVSDNANTANYANNANYANYAGNAFSVNVANVVGIGNIAVLNLDGNSGNVLYGNGIFAPAGTATNANYANYAGNVTINAQPNITTVGNLVYLNVRDDSNANSVIQQFVPNSTPIWTGSATSNAAYRVTTQYWPNASTGYPTQSFVRSRGNSTTPTTAVNNDRVAQDRYLVYNGNANVAIGAQTWSLINAGTLSNLANQAWAGGQWTISTGNPLSSDLANSSAGSPTNQLSFTNSGALTITRSTPANASTQTSSMISITDYGGNIANLTLASGIVQQRARGNRDANLSVQPNDVIGRMVFAGYNGTIFDTTNSASVTGYVDNSYTANNSIIPISISLNVLGNVGGVATYKTTQFYGNGLVTFPGNIRLGNSSLLSDTTGNSVSFGRDIDISTQGANSVAIGVAAGNSTQGANSVAIGSFAGTSTQGANAIAVGRNAGQTSQGIHAIGIGRGAGTTSQGNYAVGIGSGAGASTQGSQSVAVGRSAGTTSQGNNSVALGVTSGFEYQGVESVAIGHQAGAFSMGANSVAIGAYAGNANLAANSIVLNATGIALDQAIGDSFTVKPIRNANTANVLYYNVTSGEITYDAGSGGLPGGSNTQLQFNNNGAFGGISTVTWDGSNLSLGGISNVKITGGVNNEVIRTDGAGNLSFTSIAETLLVGTRAGPYTVPITNYTFQVTTRLSGNVTVYVN